MNYRSTAEKVLFTLTALGGLLTVAAVALFALAGSGFGSDLLRHAAGFALGLSAVMLLTRSPERGRRVAALLLLVSLIGTIMLALVFVEPSANGREQDDPEFLTGLLVSAAIASIWRLLGVNPRGPRADQASRRRS